MLYFFLVYLLLTSIYVKYSIYDLLYIKVLLLLFLLLIGVCCVRLEESENTLSVQKPEPHTINPRKEEKDKTAGVKKERADHDNRKSFALLLKPASPTPSETGSLRSFQRDTERGTKLLQYWEVLQQGGVNECLWAIKAPRVTRANTYGKGNAPLKWCIGFTLNLK